MQINFCEKVIMRIFDKEIKTYPKYNIKCTTE